MQVRAAFLRDLGDLVELLMGLPTNQQTCERFGLTYSDVTSELAFSKIYYEKIRGLQTNFKRAKELIKFCHYFYFPCRFGHDSDSPSCLTPCRPG